MKTHSRFLYLIIIIFLFGFYSSIASGQSRIDSLQVKLKNADQVEQVNLLNQISKLYEHQIPDSSFHYASMAGRLAKEIDFKPGRALSELYIGNYFTNTNRHERAIVAYDLSLDLYTQLQDKEGLLKAFNNKGNMYRIIGDYDEALFNFIESLKMSEELGNQKGIAYASLNIGLIYATRLGENVEQGLPYFLQALEICKEIDDSRCVAYAINNIALVFTTLKEYDKALDYHQQSLQMKEEGGDQYGIASSYSNMSDVYFLKGEMELALDYNEKAVRVYRKLNDLRGIVSILLEMAKINYVSKKFDDAKPYLIDALSKLDSITSLRLKSACYRYNYEFYLAQGKYQPALEYYQKFIDVKDSIYSENSSEQIAEMQTLYETEKKEAAISQLMNENTIQELELKKSEDMQWFFTVVSFLTLLLASFVYYGYRHKMVSNKLLRERNKLEIEYKKKAISLFGQQVSSEVAQELLSDTFTSTSKKLFACIMFLDIRGFTPFVENKEPSEIINYQNEVFGFMIDLVSKHHGIVNQFLGDGFMATFGAPASSGNDCQNAVNASLEIVKLLQQKCEAGNIAQTKVGVGLHVGEIVTGNVGTAERKQYSITGNTVILASRIEQLNKNYNSEILISKEVFDELEQQDLQHENMGMVALKGRLDPMAIIRLV